MLTEKLNAIHSLNGFEHDLLCSLIHFCIRVGTFKLPEVLVFRCVETKTKKESHVF